MGTSNKRPSAKGDEFMSDVTTFINAIAWPGDDGILKFAPIREEGRMAGETEVDYHTRARAGLIARGYLTPATPFAVVPLTSFPGSGTHNRVFRDCWRFVTGNIAVDITAARQQQLASITEDYDKRMKTGHERWIHANIKLDNVKKKEIEDYCKDLETTLGAITASLNALTTWEAVAAYEPTWPVEPV